MPSAIAIWYLEQGDEQLFSLLSGPILVFILH